MTKISKKIFGTILIILSLFLPINVLAINTQNDTLKTPITNSFFSEYDYVIDAYDINIVVNENNSFDITETIIAYFNVPKHGIYRKIPLNNKIVRLDGTSSTNRAKISNLTVNTTYETSKSNGVYNIQMGDADKTVTGSQTYVIKYNYNIGKDPIKNYDELYYNIIGDEWDTSIEHVTFTITMPKEFDKSKLGFSHGRVGFVDSNDVFYQVNGNVITGQYNGKLNKGEALTVRCELPEGYFAFAQSNLNILDYLILIIPIIGLLVSFILWFIFGRDKKVIETVEFYPPKDFNSLEVGFLYKGVADIKDITSLLIYLAEKGYIQILEEPNESNILSQDVKIIKLKDYDKNNVNERLFLNGLFANSTSTNGTSTYLSELYNKFYRTIQNISQNINTKENRKKIFEQQASSKKIIIIFFAIISFLLITTVPFFNYGDIDDFLPALLFPGLGFIVMIFCLFKGATTYAKVVGTIFGLVYGGLTFITKVLPVIINEPLYMISYFTGIICIFGMSIFLIFLPKRNTYGLEILGKIKGFKTYLETVEKKKLEAMIMQNPNYFYDILPYTYVLGVSDKWIKKFESITMPAPVWYTSPRPFNVIVFGKSINHTMSQANSAMSSSPKSSGGSSGGGSAGGGSGGGGGGSW